MSKVCTYGVSHLTMVQGWILLVLALNTACLVSARSLRQTMDIFEFLPDDTRGVMSPSLDQDNAGPPVVSIDGNPRRPVILLPSRRARRNFNLDCSQLGSIDPPALYQQMCIDQAALYDTFHQLDAATDIPKLVEDYEQYRQRANLQDELDCDANINGVCNTSMEEFVKLLDPSETAHVKVVEVVELMEAMGKVLDTLCQRNGLFEKITTAQRCLDKNLPPRHRSRQVLVPGSNRTRTFVNMFKRINSTMCNHTLPYVKAILAAHRPCANLPSVELCGPCSQHPACSGVALQGSGAPACTSTNNSTNISSVDLQCSRDDLNATANFIKQALEKVKSFQSDVLWRNRNLLFGHNYTGDWSSAREHCDWRDTVLLE